MSTNKKIAFVVVIIAVIGGIWYLESIKVRSSGNNGTAQPIDATSLLNENTSTATAPSVNATATKSPGAVTAPLSILSSAQKSAIAKLAAADKAAGDQPAIDIHDPTGFINTSSDFRLSHLIGGKVILVDFWTYSCINCVRTIPYLNAWYQKYKDMGLEIVGVHTPEFDFEKSLTNVQSAVTQYGIKYPVVLDSNHGTWDAYNNLYWPHEYLIDMAGYVVHDHIGEGDYDVTEKEIQTLLAQRAAILGTSATAIPTSTVGITPPNLAEIASPETYFGANRNSLLANGDFFSNGTQSLTTPQTIELNKLYLGGTWNFYDQYAKNTTSLATITYKYDAANVYIVAAAPGGSVTVQILQDGKPIGTAAGDDVQNGTITISGNKLYNLVKNPGGAGEHTLQLIIEQPGLEAFTFTFG